MPQGVILKGALTVMYNSNEVTELLQRRNHKRQSVESLRRQLEQARGAGDQTSRLVIPSLENQLAHQEPRLQAVEEEVERRGWDNAGGLGPLVDGGDGFLYGAHGAAMEMDPARRTRTRESGTVFRIKKGGSDYATLHRFEGPPLDGGRAYRAPFAARDRMLYGIAVDGGNSGAVIYRFDRDGNKYQLLFNPREGFWVASELFEDSHGNVYFWGLLPDHENVVRHGHKPMGMVELYRIAGGRFIVVEETVDRFPNLDLQQHRGSIYGWYDLPLHHGGTGTALLRYTFPPPETPTP